MTAVYSTCMNALHTERMYLYRPYMNPEGPFVRHPVYLHDDRIPASAFLRESQPPDCCGK